jgi:type IV pilus modification protein PilV
MIEVLVAMSLTAVAMLGILLIQARVTSWQKNATDARTAAQLASDFVERVALNFSGFMGGAYGVASPLVLGKMGDVPAPQRSCIASCSPSELAQWDWWLLQREVRNRLPGGVVMVTSPVDGVGSRPKRVEVRLGWIDPRRSEGEPSAPDPVCAAFGNQIDDVRYRCFAISGYP